MFIEAIESNDVKLINTADSVVSPIISVRFIGNREILENIRRADTLGVPITVRTPIIPDINDTVENIRSTAAFLKELNHVVAYELLPYHPLGRSKAEALGVTAPSFPIPTKEHMEELKQYADLSR